jgi:hypothetical protein
MNAVAMIVFYTLVCLTVTSTSAVDTEEILRRILTFRGQRVLLDSELAALYRVETKALNRAVRRNIERFPADFMFQLSSEESALLRSQIGALKSGRGAHRKYTPYVFTEQGVTMLSSVLRSERAVQVNIEIMRAFARLRQLVSIAQSLRTCYLTSSGNRSACPALPARPILSQASLEKLLSHAY